MLQCAFADKPSRMRIAFVHSSRETFRSTGARVRIGGGAENDLALSGAGVAARHLAIVEDRRGLVLEVLPGASHVYVNARPVRERGLLRYGDTLSIGGCKLLLLSDESRERGASIASAPSSDAIRPGFAALRAVSGALSGKLLPVETKLILGGRGPVLPGVTPSCSVQVCGQELVLEAADAGVQVNGLPGTRSRLVSGDQVTLGEHRFVVEAPGLQVEAATAATPIELPPPRPRTEPRASRAEFGWLLGTAALLAVIIALLLWWRH